MILIGDIEQFKDEQFYPISINKLQLLLIHHQQNYYLIANQCGHFGVPLNDASIKGHEIICSNHGISFDLSTGLVVNRPYENCDPIKIYPLTQIKHQLYATL